MENNIQTKENEIIAFIRVCIFCINYRIINEFSANVKFYFLLYLYSTVSTQKYDSRNGRAVAEVVIQFLPHEKIGNQ